MPVLKKASVLKKAFTLSITFVIPCAIFVWLPGSASAGGKVPTIAKAEMVDANNDGKADEVVLTYANKVNHTLQKSGVFPFSVEGYVVTKVLAADASKKLVVDLQERAVSDLTVTPFITYIVPHKDPVVSTSGTAEADQTFIATTAVSPASAIYVATAGSDSNPGTPTSPKATIQAAIATAVGLTPIPDVYVASGSYSEPSGLNLESGVNLDGGYTAGTWTRSLEAVTTIQGAPQAVLANGISGVTLQLLTLSGGSDATADPSVYGLRAIDSSATLQWVTISAATGNAGAPGAAGDPGSSGSTGQNGANGTSTGGGGGGQGATSEDGATGGPGANGVSGITPGIMGTGGAGDGPGSGGGPGSAGSCNTESDSPGGPGGPGGAGHYGSAGSQGAGGTNSTLASGGSFAGDAGSSGTAGTAGGGGGGGGSGGGSVALAPPLYIECSDTGTSGGGGGGGSGGAGGTPGAGGGFGGGSIGIYLWNSAISVDSASAIQTGSGGSGGVGGNGGSGGDAGFGGSGGAGFNTLAPKGVGGVGGEGGAGGAGGASGAGGGGAGGPSVGIFRGGSSTAYVSAGTTITVESGGAGGAGGSGLGGNAPSGAQGLSEAIF